MDSPRESGVLLKNAGTQRGGGGQPYYWKRKRAGTNYNAHKSEYKISKVFVTVTPYRWEEGPGRRGGAECREVFSSLYTC
jgi:hypothetical protein